jgi:hypothetical protein
MLLLGCYFCALAIGLPLRVAPKRCGRSCATNLNQGNTVPQANAIPFRERYRDRQEISFF